MYLFHSIQDHGYSAIRCTEKLRLEDKLKLENIIILEPVLPRLKAFLSRASQ
jgi:hypothetical protein